MTSIRPAAETEEIRIVFDGPPAAVSGRFVEVEDAEGRSISRGKWHERPDGMWELRINAILADPDKPAIEILPRREIRGVSGEAHDKIWNDAIEAAAGVYETAFNRAGDATAGAIRKLKKGLAS